MNERQREMVYLVRLPETSEVVTAAFYVNTYGTVCKEISSKKSIGPVQVLARQRRES
jgi:hypothetical protein